MIFVVRGEWAVGQVLPVACLEVQRDNTDNWHNTQLSWIPGRLAHQTVGELS